MKCFISGFFLLFTIASCSTLKPQSKYAHLDFKKWNRTEDCCEAKGQNVAISSGGTHSTECGKKVLGEGGNIVDSAVAVAFCLAVERPQSISIAGGGFMLLHLQKPKPQTLFIDFRETAPSKTSPPLFREPLQKDGNGLLVGTPGFVAGLYEIQTQYGALKGRKGWRQVLEPARSLAERGFSVYPSLAEKIETRKEGLSKDEVLKPLFLPGNKPLKVGDQFIQKELAGTLAKIAKEGPKGFYEGKVAESIVQLVKDKGGILTKKDLKDYRPRVRAPLSVNALGRRIVTAPPPSSGGIQVLQIIKAMEKIPPSENALPQLAKIFRTSFSQRYEEVGDPDFVKVSPMRKLILETKPVDTSQKAKIESPDTTHLSLIDAEGNAVSATISQNYFFGAAIGVPGTGILLNDQLTDFSLEGKNKLNLPLPKRRPLSNMSPTIVFENEKPVLVLGAAGGPQIVTAVSQVILNRYLRGMSLKESVFAPRIHHHFNPDKLFPERGGFSEEELKVLRAAGFELADPTSYSQVNAVEADPKTSELRAVSEPRDEGGAFGY